MARTLSAIKADIEAAILGDVTVVDEAAKQAAKTPAFSFEIENADAPVTFPGCSCDECVYWVNYGLKN